MKVHSAHIKAVLSSAGCGLVLAGTATVTELHAQAATVTQYVMAPTPIAANGSLPPSTSVSVKVTAEDSNGTPVPNAIIFLRFTHASGGGSATVGSTPLGSSALSFTSSSGGQLTVVYQTPSTLPATGLDTITAQNAGSSPTVTAKDTYNFASPAIHYHFTPRPIAPSASLGASATVPVSVQVQNSSNVGVPGSLLYLSFQPTSGGGSASVGSTVLTATPQPFTADGSGKVAIQYRTPATLPSGGVDTITAQNRASSPSHSATDTYTFSPTVRVFHFSPKPIAGSGTLTTNTALPVTLTAETGSGTPIPGATVYLSFGKATGGGSATVGSTSLTASPQPFTANGSGTITITYTTPATLPTAGVDVITAQNSATSPTVSAQDSYGFAKIATLVFSPKPIAATGTLSAGQTVTVTLTAKDAGGKTIPNAYVYLLFSPAPNGGSASVGTTPLDHLTRFITNASGQVVITYHASASHPPSGTDTLTAQNARTTPTVTGTDTYVY